MLATKQIADLFTYLRVFLAVALVYLGWAQGESALPLAIWIMIVSWTSDSLDGPLARRSKPRAYSWIGDHDLEVDMLVSLGLLIYMTFSGFVGLFPMGLYLLLSFFVFLHFGIERSLGMLFQAPIYGSFLVESMRISPATGSWMIGWIIAVLVITWPRFLEDVVPGFLQGIREIRAKQKANGR